MVVLRNIVIILGLFTRLDSVVVLFLYLVLSDDDDDDDDAVMFHCSRKNRRKMDLCLIPVIKNQRCENIK